MRTWVYRVAHNIAISRITRRRAHIPTFVTLDEVAETAVEEDVTRAVDRRIALERLLGLIQSLDPLDRQVILLYLEEVDEQSIAAIVGLSRLNTFISFTRSSACCSKAPTGIASLDRRDRRCRGSCNNARRRSTLPLG
jgi:RNA polymerase sigma-70 factor, ECF subfamily